MRLPRFLPALAALLALASAAAPAGAQGAARPGATGTINVGATILFPPLTAVGVKPIQFGIVPAGTSSVTVLPNTPQGGEWRLTGIRNRRTIDISFVLPAALVNARGAQIPISFDGTYAGLCEIDEGTGACDPLSRTFWNPVTTPVFHDTPERSRPGRPRYASREYTIYLGGRLLPPPAPQAGTYTATVTVQLAIN